METNKLIAEFMRLEIINADIILYALDGIAYPINKLEYHTSWDWLMPVVQKCYKIDNEEGFDNLVDAVSTLDIEATYKAVVEFINQNK